MIPLEAHNAESMCVCFLSCLLNSKCTHPATTLPATPSPAPRFSIIHAAFGTSYNYSTEGKPSYHYLCLNIPTMQRKGQAIYHHLNFSTFSTLSLAQRSSQENLPSPASLVLVVTPLVHLGLLSPPHQCLNLS